MEAVKMLKRSLCVVSLVGLMAMGAAAQDYVLEYSPLTIPAVATPTPIEISLLNNTGADLAIGGLVFDFSAPGGGLMWDLDGPDDTGFTPDDDFIWEPWLDGSGHPDFGTNDYFATIDPPQTGFLSSADLFAVTVPAGSSARVATLIITGMAEGVFPLIAGNAEEILTGGVTAGFPSLPVAGAETQITVIPEPATLGLLGLGGLMFLRRRR
jgi:hypothetical protein